MKIISIINQKGGVGKTTSAINIAYSSTLINKKTLLIDIDSQGNTSSRVNILKKEDTNSSYELIYKKQKIKPIKNFNLDIILSNLKLALLEKELIHEIARENFLKNALEQYKQDDYDLIILDCPPHALNTHNKCTCCKQISSNTNRNRIFRILGYQSTIRYNNRC